MYWGSRTGQIVNFVYFQVERKCNIMTNQLKIRVIQQMDDVALGPGIKVIHAYDIASIFENVFW